MISTNMDVQSEIISHGFSFVSGSGITFPASLNDSLQQLLQEWEGLLVDEYLKEGSRFRYRRHGRFSFCTKTQALTSMPNDGYFQPSDINSYAGGVNRRFAPLTPATINNKFFLELLKFNFNSLPLKSVGNSDDIWIADVHVVRIVATSNTLGQPTPEGIHNDGFKYLSFHLFERNNVGGGVSEVYSPKKELIESQLLEKIMDCWFADDEQVMHATSPISLLSGDIGWRDMLLFSYHRQV